VTTSGTFNERKAAQLAAFFALRSGGSINVLKLVKLVYLSDREFLKRYDSPILFDRLVSMPHGPVNSFTYGYVSGQLVSEKWDEFIADRALHDVGVVDKEVHVSDLDELSEAELEILGHVWIEFGHMSGWEIRNYTHENCEEWEDPDGSSTSIPYERVLKALGKGHVASDISKRIASEREIQRKLAD
jgi:uncharacterized phage-associated protein